LDVFSLFAKIGLDTSDYERGLNDASGKTHSFGEKLKSGLSMAAKTVTVAVGAATTAIGALAKSSLDGYAEYEQLVGGVETLFGAGGKSLEEYAESVGGMTDKVKRQYNDLITAQEFVMEDAANAYKTAGLSANEYMETVTSFSAALIQSLGGDTMAAAEYANTAITDMSDNANKMGTAMDSIQNAYQGFAKQNFTMLDNLKLGYGGTKEEMQRLLEDAEKLSGIEYDISSYADIVDAIHVVQTEMGITGTTALEASTTIQGSVDSMKSAWQNLVVGIADENADLDGLIGNFVDSVATAGENIIPRVEQILTGMGTVVEKLGPIIAEKLPSIISSVLPSMVESGMQLLGALGQGLIDNLPAIMDSAVQIVTTLVQDISQSLPELIPAAMEAITTIVQGLIDNLPMLLEGALQLVQGLADGIIEAIPVLIEALPELIQGIVDFLIEGIPMLIDAAISIIDGIVAALPDIIQALIDALPSIIESLVSGLISCIGALVQGAIQLVVALVTHMPEIIASLIEAIPYIITSIIDGFVDGLGSFVECGGQIMDALWQGIQDIWDSMVTWFTQTIPELIGNIGTWFSELPGKVGQWFTEVFNNVKAWGSNMWNKAQEIAKDFVNKFVNFVKELPGKLWEWLQNAISKVTSFASDLWNKAVEAGANLVKGLWDGIQGLASWLWEQVSGWISGIWDGICNFFGIHSPSTEMAWVGEMLVKGLAGSINENGDEAVSAAENMSENILKTMDGLGKEMENAISSDLFPNEISSSVKAYSGQGRGTESGLYGSSVFHITINGAKYSDEQSLARAVAQEIQYMTERRSAAFATA